MFFTKSINQPIFVIFVACTVHSLHYVALSRHICSRICCHTGKSYCHILGFFRPKSGIGCTVWNCCFSHGRGTGNHLVNNCSQFDSVRMLCLGAMVGGIWDSMIGSRVDSRAAVSRLRSTRPCIGSRASDSMLCPRECPRRISSVYFWGCRSPHQSTALAQHFTDSHSFNSLDQGIKLEIGFQKS